MSTSLLADAFGHHVWATLTLFDSLADLTPEQMETSCAGTYGSIRETVQHLVGGRLLLPVRDRRRLAPTDRRGDDGPGRAARRDGGQRPGLDGGAGRGDRPGGDAARVRDDGSSLLAPKGIRLAQVLHHGTDHRSQICTALTQLGIELPPLIDVWDYGFHENRLVETPPTATAET